METEVTELFEALEVRSLTILKDGNLRFVLGNEENLVEITTHMREKKITVEIVRFKVEEGCIFPIRDRFTLKDQAFERSLYSLLEHARSFVRGISEKIGGHYDSL